MDINGFKDRKSFSKVRIRASNSRFQQKFSTERIDNFVNFWTYSVDHEFGHQMYFAILFYEQMIHKDSMQNSTRIKNKILKFSRNYDTCASDFISEYG